MQSGLWSKRGPVPLQNVTVKARINEFTAQVDVSQTYCHNESAGLETTFKFPLSLFGALCNFEVVLEGKEIVSTEVRKREEARKITMEDDITADTSYLLEEDQPDVFLCNIGNLSPGKPVEIRLTYVTELSYEGEALRFVLPFSTISPNYLLEDDSNSKSQTNPHSLNISLNLSMPSDIQKIESPTHGISIKDQVKNKAVVELKKEKSLMEGNFVLLVNYTEPHNPWSIVEDQESKANDPAVLLSFFPQITSLQEMPRCEIIFLVDCSNSMGGSHLQHVKSALHLFLRSLPTKTFFNIYKFGDNFDKLSTQSLLYDDDTLQKATAYIDDMDADLGGTELFEPLSDVYSSPPMENLPRQLFIITDGQVTKTNQVLRLVSKNSHDTRVFTFGIGDRVSHYLVTGMARAGCGESEFVTGKEGLEGKVMRQLKRALQPALTNAKVEWGELDGVVTTPERLPTLFNGDRLLVYGFIPRSKLKKATVTLKANAPQSPVQFSVTVDPSQSREDDLIHRLAASARIRELEMAEEEDARDEIVRLGLTYGLASSFTSFVAVEPSKKNSDKQHRLGLHSSLELPIPRAVIDRDNANSAANIDRSSSPSLESNQISPTKPNKKQYAPDFLMRFKTICTDLPEGLNAPLDIILGNTAPASKRDSTPKSPKPTRGGRGGKGGGGGHRRAPSGGNRASPAKGKGKDAQPAQPPLPPLEKSDNRWIRPAKANDDREIVFRKAQGLLNKLTIEKFDVLSEQILNVGIIDYQTLTGIIKLVFDKAVMEPHFSTMYAVLCKKLSIQCPSFPDEEGNEQTFRRILLNKCQQEFENKPTVPTDVTDATRDELELKIKKRVLGNIRFIGELYKEGMLPEKIMHAIIGSMLQDYENPAEENVESLCKLINTIGKDLDNSKSGQKMDEYFDKLNAIYENKNLISRIRFMARDLIDLRSNNWVPRRKENDPKTIAAARAEAAREKEENAATTTTPIKRSESREQLNASTGFQDIRSERADLKSSGGRGRVRYEPKRSPSKEQWEVSGSGRGTPQRGRGKVVVERYAPKTKTEDTKSSKELQKSASFTALQDDSNPSLSSSTGSLKSALRSTSSLTLERKTVTVAPSSPRKEVTIQEPGKPELSTDQLESKTDMLLEEFLSSGEKEEAASCIEELSSPDYHGDIIHKAVLLALEKKDRDRSEMLNLFSHLASNGFMMPDDFAKGFSSVLEVLEEEIEPDIPFAPKYLATFIANAMTYDNPLPLSFLNESLNHMIQNGKAANMAANVLKALQEILKDNNTFVDMYKSSSFNLMGVLPKDKRNEENLSRFLNDKGLNVLVTSTESVEDETPEQKNFQSLIQQQAADGYWKLTEDFATTVDIPYDELKTDEDTTVWATVLALQFLDVAYSKVSDQWELLGKKAKKWLSQKDTTVIEKLQREAEKLLPK